MNSLSGIEKRACRVVEGGNEVFGLFCRRCRKRLGTSDLTFTWAKAMMLNRDGLGEGVADLTLIIPDAG